MNEYSERFLPAFALLKGVQRGQAGTRYTPLDLHMDESGPVTAPGEQLLGRWVQLERGRMGAPPEALLDVSERAELERLRRENGELRMDNEFLGKAAAFFAAKNTPGRSVSR